MSLSARSNTASASTDDRWAYFLNLRFLPDSFREFVKYGLCSAVALAVDIAVLVALTELFGLHYLVSAAIGFSCGLAVIYVLSITVVFTQRSIHDRWKQFVIFAAIGIMGLGLNQVLLFAFADYAGMDYQLAKLLTAVFIFSFNFVARKSILFVARRR